MHDLKQCTLTLVIVFWSIYFGRALRCAPVRLFAACPRGAMNHHCGLFASILHACIVHTLKLSTLNMVRQLKLFWLKKI